MSLKEKLLEDLKAAMKSGDVVKKNAVQMVRAAVLQVEKDNKSTLDDDGVLDIISKEVKKRRDALPEYEKSGRQELVENLLKEIDVLSVYLPEQLSIEEVEVIVKEAMKTAGAVSIRDMGKIMQEVLPKVKGRADGKVVNEIVKRLL